MHFPIIYNKHLSLEQHNNLLVFKHRTPHRRGNCLLLTDHVAFECLGRFLIFPALLQVHSLEVTGPIGEVIIFSMSSVAKVFSRISMAHALDKTLYGERLE